MIEVALSGKIGANGRLGDLGRGDHVDAEDRPHDRAAEADVALRVVSGGRGARAVGIG